jgi:sugar phosphate isomerase/epimerase
MNPRFGFRTGSFTDWTVEQAATHLAHLGYDCVEICLERPDVRPETLDKKRCTELRLTLEGLGVDVASVSYHGDKEPPAARLVNQERAIQVAAWLAADIVVLNAERTADRKRQWAEHVSHYQRLCALAGDVGVNIALEPEPLLLIDNSQDMMAMLEAVGSRHLKVNFDVGHAQVTDDDPAESIRMLGGAIVHLHLEDIKDRVHRHLPFGEGEIDFTAVVKALADIRYPGPYVADLFGVDDPQETAARALPAMRERFS